MITLDNMEYSSDALARAAWAVNYTTPEAQQETADFYEVVRIDGGTVVSIDDIDNAVIAAKTNSYYTNIKGWYSSQFAYYNAGNNKVSKLYDLSSNKYHFYHPSSNCFPTWIANQQNGRAGIIFDGSDDTLIKSSTTVCTVFIVFKSWSTGDWYKHLLGNNDGSAEFHGGTGSNQWLDGNEACSAYNWVNGVSIPGPNVVKTTNCTILTLRYTSAFHVAQLCWAQNYFGGRAYPGNIMELILIDNEISDTLRMQIEADLNSRWAVV